MNPRTKTLAAVFGAVILLIFADRVIRPRWIDPLLTIDDRIGERQKTLDALRAEQEAVELAVEEFKALAARTGSFNTYQVQTTMLDQLSTLIEKHKLESVNITPARPRTDRQSGIARMVITLKAVAPLDRAVLFLRDLAELPQLARIGTTSMMPARERVARRTSPRTAPRTAPRGGPRMTLRIPVEILVVPEQKLVGDLDPESMERPATYVRHQERNYSMIWDLDPFSEYVPPLPLRAMAGPAIHAAPSPRKAPMGGSAVGGEGEYACLWQPPDRLSDPKICDPQLDMSEEFEQVYTLYVTDEAGNAAEAQKRVSIKNPPPPPEPKVVDRTPPKPVVQRWRDGQYMQLRMAVLVSSDAGDEGEMAVFNQRARQMDYYSVGDDFDGGTLVYVHPTGAIARRSGTYYIYPIGLLATNDVAVEDADELFSIDYPRLVQMADWMKRRDEALGVPETDASGGKSGTRPRTQTPARQVRQPRTEGPASAVEDRPIRPTSARTRAQRRQAAQQESTGNKPIPPDLLERLERGKAEMLKRQAEEEKEKNKQRP